MRRGILGGTFDPPHIAHLVAAEAAFHDLGLDEVRLIPAGAPWQKAERHVTEATHRWAMTEAAASGIAYVEPDDREVRRDGWTYTVDTLATFDSDDELFLVLGADAAAGFHTWHRWEEIAERARFAIVARPGTHLEQVEAAVGPFELLDAPLLDVSGTMLRARVERGVSIRHLVPDAVREYIARHGLYA